MSFPFQITFNLLLFAGVQIVQMKLQQKKRNYLASLASAFSRKCHQQRTIQQKKRVNCLRQNFKVAQVTSNIQQNLPINNLEVKKF